MPTMNAPTKLGAFAAALAVVFGGAVAVGNAAGPVAGTGGQTSAGSHGEAHGTAAGNGVTDAVAEAGDHGAHGSADADQDLPGGLAMSQHGYTLQLADSELPVGEPTELGLTITGADGRPVTAYTPTQDKELHLIVVRRDLTGFQHVHPTRDDADTWTVPITLPAAGEYRVFADFAPGDSDSAMTLGTDLSVGGTYDPQPLPAPQRTAIVDGYTVTLDGDLIAGQESELTLSVSKDGRPVTDLQPYLAAYGHLVALRDGDLAYLHVHPDGEPGDGRTPAGPGITFYATAPTVGDYGLFLDFRHQDVVRTATFTARANAASGVAEHGTDPTDVLPAPANGGHDPSDGHGH